MYACGVSMMILAEMFGLMIWLTNYWLCTENSDYADLLVDYTIF